MNKLLIALESEFVEPVEMAVAYEPPIDSVIQGVEEAINIAAEAYDRLIDLKSSCSLEDYHITKSWMQEKACSVGMEMQFNIAAESHLTAQSLALEGLGDFIKNIFEYIKKGFMYIVNFIKGLFSNKEKDSREYEKTMAKYEDELKKIVGSSYPFDKEELMKHIDTNNPEAKQKVLNKLFSYTSTSDWTGIKNHFQAFNGSLDMLISTWEKVYGPQSATKAFINSLNDKTTLETLLTDATQKEKATDIPLLKMYLDSVLSESSAAMGMFSSIPDREKEYKKLLTQSQSNSNISINTDSCKIRVFPTDIESEPSSKMAVVGYLSSSSEDTDGVKDVKSKMSYMRFYPADDNIIKLRLKPDFYILDKQEIANLLLMSKEYDAKEKYLTSKLMSFNSDSETFKTIVNSISSELSKNSGIKQDALKTLLFILGTYRVQYESWITITSIVMYAKKVIDSYSNASLQAYTASYS